MNKTEFIKKLAEKAQVSTKEAELFLNATLNCISDAMVDGEKIQLKGFGVFEAKQRAERTGLNPRTKEVIQIAAKRAPTFVASKTLKDAMV